MPLSTMTQTMSGRTCVVTGATSGVGFETARSIAQQGATVVIVGRSPGRNKAAVDRITEQTGNPNVDGLAADLSIQADIRRLAAVIAARYPRLHVLVNNVGGLFLNGQVSADGIEMTLALNHLGGYLLTCLLIPVLEAGAPSRIINVSSVAHLGARLDSPTLRFSGWKGYKRSKLANILFTYELARRLEGSAVTVNALHPGFVDSGFGKNNSGLFRRIRPLVYFFAISPEKGARTSVYLACSPDVEGVTGKYFVRCKPRRSSRASYDRDAAARLWQVSAAMSGVTPG
jgi:NAD(P)-dependent dehydrogenase (short-subunit alcohol dehydrogenase family)